MQSPPTLDAHAHFAATRRPDELANSGAVLASTLSLEEAERDLGRSEPLVAWGVGCHPRTVRAQAAFDEARFHALAQRMPFVGEVGLDPSSRVPMERQLEVFRQALAVAADLRRPVSIHSYWATRWVLDELHRQPVAAPILHWWTGNAAETSEAVALGCCFSIHQAVARRSTWHTRVPLERVLVESDHGYDDPPAAIPCRVQWVEYLAAQQYRLDVAELRCLVWRNLARIVGQTDTWRLYSAPFLALLAGAQDSKPVSLSDRQLALPC